jgi:competence protein ComEC
MYELSAPNIVVAPLEPARSSYLSARIKSLGAGIEAFLEAERAQLPLWFVVAVGAGIVSWIVLPGEMAWLGLLALAAALAVSGIGMRHSRRGSALLGIGAGLAV